MPTRTDTAGAHRADTSRIGKAVTVPIAGALGVALGYLFDPDRGKGRRRKLADQAAGTVRRQERRALAQARYRRGRLQGKLLRAVGAGRPKPTDDVDVKQQIHRALRAAGMRSGDITVEVSDRTAVLRGQAPSRADVDRIEQVVERVSGVREVRNLLHEPGEPAPNKIEALRLSHSRSGPAQAGDGRP